MELPALIALLRANGIHKFKDEKFEIEFDSMKLPAADVAPALVDAPMPANMPEDLKNPETMSFDKILSWSASPGHDDAVAPLEGVHDAPIMGGEP